MSSTIPDSSPHKNRYAVSTAAQRFLGIEGGEDSDAKRMSMVELSRTVVNYIKAHHLQADPTNLRVVFPDEKLSELLGTDQPITYYQLQRYLVHQLIR